MKKTIYRLLSVSLAILLFLSVPITGKAEEADSIAALTKAEDYLSSKITDPVAGSVGGEWSVIAMAREDRLTESAREEYLKNLQYVLEQKKGVLHRTKYTEYSRVVLALTAIGTDPCNVNGYNVLEPLADYNKVTKQGINGAVYALIALDSGKYEVPKLATNIKDGVQTTRDKLIDFILKSELADGGWGLLDTPDDMTPMAIQALAPYKDRTQVKEAIDRAVHTLSSMQEADGGFSAQSGSETISQTLIALSIYDVSLISSSDFIKNGKSLLDALLMYQNENGSFSHIRGQSENIMATDQAILALSAYKRAINHQNSLYDMSDVTLRQDIPELEYIPGIQGNSDSVKIPDLNGELAVQGTKVVKDETETQKETVPKKEKTTKKKVVRKKRVKKKKPVKHTEKTTELKKENPNTKEPVKEVQKEKSYTLVIWGSVIGLVVAACIATKIVLEVKRRKIRRRK